jgi:hypothetical protein
MRRATSLLGAALLGAALLSVVAPAPTLEGQASPRCAAAEFRQLDFWIGTWEVTDPEGAPVGRSTIETTLGGCAVREAWDSGDVHGSSLNAFDRPAGVWRQMWADDGGGVLLLEGGWSGDAMVLRGTRIGSDGKTRALRVTLRPAEDGTVRQLQERSEDGGRTWGVIFDGRYRRSGSRPRRRAGSPRSAPAGSG